MSEQQTSRPVSCDAFMLGLVSCNLMSSCLAKNQKLNFNYIYRLYKYKLGKNAILVPKGPKLCFRF